MRELTEQQWRSQMLRWKKSLAVIDGMELIDVMIADLDREKQMVAQMKKAAGQGRLGLRSRLKELVVLFYHRIHVREKRGIPGA